MPHRTIHLFRKGLRLHDNPTLLAALESSEVVYPVYILDRTFVTSAMHIGALRWHFLLQSLEDLRQNLCQLGSCLLVLQGEYEAVLRDHARRWEITQVTLDAETEPFYKEMEANIQRLGEELGFQVLSLVGHSLYDTRRILELNGGTPPLTYKRFLQVLSLLGDPKVPVRNLTAEDFQCKTPDPGLADCYRVPLPADLKIPPESLSPWRGGETEGLQRLEQHLTDQGWVASFTKPRTIPNSLLPSTTGLSPYFSLGCLSVRTFFYRLSNIYAQVRKHLRSFPSPSLMVFWMMRPAQVCSRVKARPLGFGVLCLPSGKLSCWRSFPACPLRRVPSVTLRLPAWFGLFFTTWLFQGRFSLSLPIPEGQVFEELLLDADYSINAGNWMWLSASAFFHQYTRIFCPVRFGKRTDPEGHYIRKYLPVLKNFASKYIYEPWMASEEEQKQAGCIIGQDYPFPMVNHKEASDHNLQLMKQVREEQQRTAQLTR
ncbi:CRY1 protein, partial [Trogon melanurus]|nr:CRY1 protein [Trogon melanurus]